MVEVAVGAGAPCYLHHRAVLALHLYAVALVTAAYDAAALVAQHLPVHGVGYGAYGAHGHYHGVLHHADIQVGIGAHHVGGTARGDVFVHVHRVGVGFLSCSAEDDIEAEEVGEVGAVDRSILFSGRYHTVVGIQGCAVAELQGEPSLKLHFHLIGQLECRAFRQGGAAAASWRVAQDVDEQRCAAGQHVLAFARGKQVQHIAAQGLCLVGGAVLRQRHRHGAQGVITGQQARCGLGHHVEGTFAVGVEFHRLLVQSVLHAVVNGDGAAAHAHAVFTPRARIIII